MCKSADVIPLRAHRLITLQFFLRLSAASAVSTIIGAVIVILRPLASLMILIVTSGSFQVQFASARKHIGTEEAGESAGDESSCDRGYGFMRSVLTVGTGWRGDRGPRGSDLNRWHDDLRTDSKARLRVRRSTCALPSWWRVSEITLPLLRESSGMLGVQSEMSLWGLNGSHLLCSAAVRGNGLVGTRSDGESRLIPSSHCFPQPDELQILRGT